jgi:hypothetical protein
MHDARWRALYIIQSRHSCVCTQHRAYIIQCSARHSCQKHLSYTCRQAGVALRTELQAEVMPAHREGTCMHPWVQICQASSPADQDQANKHSTVSLTPLRLPHWPCLTTNCTPLPGTLALKPSGRDSRRWCSTSMVRSLKGFDFLTKHNLPQCIAYLRAAAVQATQSSAGLRYAACRLSWVARAVPTPLLPCPASPPSLSLSCTKTICWEENLCRQQMQPHTRKVCTCRTQRIIGTQ